MGNFVNEKHLLFNNMHTSIQKDQLNIKMARSEKWDRNYTQSEMYKE